MFRLSFSALHRRIAPWLILLLVLAAGLRVCIPVTPAAGDVADGIHLESMLTAATDQHESHSGDEQDLPLFALLGLFALGLAAVTLVTGFPAAFTSFPACHQIPSRRPDERCLRPPRGAGITPQLRAPPR